jgi:hypothetical protein
MIGSIRPARLLAVLPLVAAIAWVAGCGGGKSKTESVSGKVTLDGKPVSGEITFVCSDGKEIKSPLGTDGGYSILAPAKGEAKIGIKSMTAAVGGGKEAGKEGASKSAELPGMGGSSGAVPPAKYGNPASSGLTYTVKGGEEKHDITLSP